MHFFVKTGFAGTRPDAAPISGSDDELSDDAGAFADGAWADSACGDSPRRTPSECGSYRSRVSDSVDSGDENDENSEPNRPKRDFGRSTKMMDCATQTYAPRETHARKALNAPSTLEAYTIKGSERRYGDLSHTPGYRPKTRKKQADDDEGVLSRTHQ